LSFIILFFLTACNDSDSTDPDLNSLDENGDRKYLEDLSDTWIATEEILSHSVNSDLVGDISTYEIVITKKSATIISLNDGNNSFTGQLTGTDIDFGYNFPHPTISGNTIYIRDTDLTLSADGSTIEGTFKKEIHSDPLFPTVDSVISFKATRNIEDTYENNDTLESAVETTPQLEYKANQFDDDWFTLTPSEDKLRLQINVTFQHNDGDIDLALYNALGTLIFEATSLNDNETIDVEVSLSQTYYLRIFGDSDGNKGNPYVLKWNNLSP